MKNTLNKTQAVNELLQDQNAGWSRKGAEALIDYLLEMEDAMGEELEFDPVAFRCDFNEWGNMDEFLDNYNDIDDDYIKDDEGNIDEDKLREEIEKKTTLIVLGDNLEGGFITQAF